MKKLLSLIFIFLLTILFVVYVSWDNRRITVEKQDISIENLPKQLEGFRILQVTDLHEREFGENQDRLINEINSIDYDVIIFTGDMLDRMESTNYAPFYTLIEGIQNKESAWYVPGNADPESYAVDNDSIEKSTFIAGMEERGVKLLELSDSLLIGDKTITFLNLEESIIIDPNQSSNVNGVVQPSYSFSIPYLSYRSNLWETQDVLGAMEDSDLTIALNHYPVPDARIDYIQNDGNTEWRDFDLIIAGHYHGGQIRLPFVGTLFIPDPWYTPNSFFPPQDRVKGLWDYEGTKQYVSTGLGSSDAISFLKFRLFNPPEINVLTFQSE